MAATCAGLGDSQAKPVCESRLLVPGLGLIEASCCLFARIEEVVKHEPRSAIHMEKQLGWAHKLDGRSLWGSPRWVSVRQVDGILAVAPVCWLCWERARKGAMASAHPDARYLSLPFMPLVPFKHWNLDRVSLSR